MEEDIKEEVKEEQKEELKIGYIDISKIERSKSNVRTLNIEDDLFQLAKSYEGKIGLMEPIKVRQKGEKYFVYDGNRRVLAARMLGWKKIPAIVQKEDEEDEKYDLVRSLISAIEKKDIDPQDKADAVLKLADELGSYQEVAKILNRDLSTIQQWLSWNQNPDEVKDAVKKGEIYRTVAPKLAESQLVGKEKVELGKMMSKMGVDDRTEAVDLIRENPKIKPSELEIELQKKPIMINFRFNTRLSNALRELAKETKETNYNALVGDIVVEKLSSKGLLVGKREN